MTTPLEQFLDELEELSVRTGIYIGGCGDCGSPWVEGGASGEHLGWSDDYYSVSIRTAQRTCNCAGFDGPHHHGPRMTTVIVRSKGGR